ncbi:MAG TPA: hypothetical protein VN644_13990 [Pyrinomonadaceae bacterium]|nr:hypothetical protein [Pyrinomonadaceae bacterium]
MRKRTRWLLGGFAVGAGAVSAFLPLLKKRKVEPRKRVGGVWARPGMPVTFRAELMPGRDRRQRTFVVEELLPSGRVSLQGVDGEHVEKEFEPVQLDRPITSNDK